MNQLFTSISSQISTYAGRAATFLLAILVIVVWGLTGPLFGFSDTWQLVVNTGTTIVTFLMVFLIQNTQNRDSAALQAKLDELLRAVGNARETKFIGVEHLTDDEIEAIRKEIEDYCGPKDLDSSNGSKPSKPKSKSAGKAKTRRSTSRASAATTAAAG